MIADADARHWEKSGDEGDPADRKQAFENPLYLLNGVSEESGQNA